MMHILVNSKTGVGLAAPQAGHLKRIIVVSANGFPTAMINPEFSYYSTERAIEEEGCLSYPGKKKDIRRYGRIKVKYWKPLCNKMFIENFFAFKSRIIQHEIDHLDGKCKVGAV
jgi:peptide deformylase